MPCFRALRRIALYLIADRRGATAVEYGLIITLIVLAMLAALNNVAGSTISMWGNVSNKFVNAR